MKKLFLPFLLIGILTSCYHEVKDVVKMPSRLLPEDSLVLVLTEVQIADGALTYQRISHKKVKGSKEKYYAYIYKKFNLTPELLEENVKYYNADPDKMAAIYDRVLENLSKLEGELNLEKNEIEKKKQDSIKAIDTTIYVRSRIVKKEKHSHKLPIPGPVWP